ncbi:MAG: hypothetical protein WCJ86_00190 [Candidatus Saccharibacteria bacterium]
MSVPNDSNPDQDQAPLSIESRLNAISQSSPENIDVDLPASVDEVMGRLFEPESHTFRSAGLVGGSDEAIAAVREGLVSRLERNSKDGLTGRDLVRSIWPISSNFADPEPTTLDAMKHRTDELERLFYVQDLQDAIYGNHSGRFISYSGEVDHPDFSWVEVYADSNSLNGIRYELFAEKPSEDSRRPFDLSITVHIRSGALNNINAPNAVSDEYPILTESDITQERRENNFKEESSLDVPSDMTPLLSKITRTMITEALVEQGVYKLELSERTKEWFNRLARRIVEEIVDPVEARKELEKLGIYEDPDSFK